MNINKCLLIYRPKTIASLNLFATSFVQHVNQVLEMYGNITKRYNSKCGNDKDGKGKKDNLSVLLHGIDDIRLEQTPIQKPGPGEVLLAMDTVGICGTDIHFLKRGKVGSFEVKKPMIIGHEASGIIAEVGKDVKNVKVGDRIAIEPGVGCRYCDFCKAGKYNLCPNMQFCAAPPVDGNLRRYYKHAADFCHKLPDHVTMEEGALLEPLSIAVASCRRAQLRLGSHVLIIGGGPIALACLIVSKAWGAASTTIVDINEHRLKVAQELGATHAMKSCQDMDVKLAAKEIYKTVGVMPDKTLDCIAKQESVLLGVYATRSGGNCVIVGMGADEINLPLMEALTREVDLLGVFRYCNDYPIAMNLLAAGGTGVKKLVTHHFDIEDSIEAFDTARHVKGNAIKVLIHVQKRDKNNKEPFHK